MKQKIDIIVNLRAIIEVPEDWIIIDQKGMVTLKTEGDFFFIGLMKDNKCLTAEKDFGLLDYLETDKPVIEKTVRM